MKQVIIGSMISLAALLWLLVMLALAAFLDSHKERRERSTDLRDLLNRRRR